MGNDFMGQILGSVLGSARAGQRPPAAGPGGLGDLLGGVLGGGGFGGAGGGFGMPGGVGGSGTPMGRGASPLGGGRGALLAMLLPLAMQWVQRNGGLGAVLQRFRQKGYDQQANSWISTGPNQLLEPDAVGDVVGSEELSRLSQQLGVTDQEVASGFAEIMPAMVNELTPEGDVPPDADQVLDNGRTTLEQLLRQAGIH